LPAKRRTEGLRADSRAEALKTGLELSKSMDIKERSIARSYFSKAVDVTPRMAAQLIQILRRTRPKVLCTVAPYEADAQLSYLCKEGLVDAIISEDSDTIPYGCKEVLFKLKHDGKCETVILKDVYGTFLPGLDLRAFTPLMTVALCVGAGCDYLEPLKGFGIKNSYKLISKHRSIGKMLWAMRTAGNIPPASANINNRCFRNMCTHICLYVHRCILSSVFIYKFIRPSDY
jgi:exonuclease-1